MSGTNTVTVGDRGRLVLPAEVRERTGIGEGTELVCLDSADGVVLLTREQLTRRVRQRLSGSSLVEELLAARRAEARAEDA